MPRIQLKIMAALAALVVAVMLVTGVIAERGLRERATRELVGSLDSRARLVALMVGGVAFDAAHARELRLVASRAAAASGARVTLMATDGRVLADSDVPDAEIAALDNHAARPEMATALAGSLGHSTRWSDTLKRKLVYVAVPAPAPPGGAAAGGVVRLALPLDEVDAAAVSLRRELATAGALGLAAALGLSFALSLLSLRPIRELSDVVSDMAEGRLGRQLRWHAHDERGQVARSINRMAQQMRDQVAGATHEKEQLEAVLASMVEGVLVVDREGRILLANPRLRELLSAWGEVEGRPVPEVIRIPEIDAALRDAAAGGETIVRELEVRSPGQRLLLMHAAVFPSTGPPSGTVCVLHDLTEIRRLDQVRRDFIANASHELRTPLSAIQGFADTLITSDLDPAQAKAYLDVIARNAQRMANLIEDLLALSRIESGRSELEISNLDVGRVAEMILSDFATRFEKASLEAELRVEPCPPCRADRHAVEQILSNLLSNAARYTNPGGRIEVHVRPSAGGVAVTVADSGIGIPEEDQERIFERFYRVDAARSRALGGTGLGLAIVKHLVGAMRGEIRVESKPGEGTRFTFVLPAAEPARTHPA